MTSSRNIAARPAPLAQNLARDLTPAALRHSQFLRGTILARASSAPTFISRFFSLSLSLFLFCYRICVRTRPRSRKLRVFIALPHARIIDSLSLSFFPVTDLIVFAPVTLRRSRSKPERPRKRSETRTSGTEIAARTERAITPKGRGALCTRSRPYPVLCDANERQLPLPLFVSLCLAFSLSGSRRSCIMP